MYENGDGEVSVSLVEGVNACGFVVRGVLHGACERVCGVYGNDARVGESGPGVHERLCDEEGVEVDVGSEYV